ncbi:hypothetical protein ACFQ0D_16395, partial [Micromonospora zhanjiangensis]
AARYDEAVEALAALDPERVGLVLSGVVRLLLEASHPDGLTGEDAQLVLTRCVRSAAGWQPDVDVDVLVRLLTGALGVHPPEEQAGPPQPVEVARHAPLLVVVLLTEAGVPFADTLTAALTEIERDQVMDLP